jgi:hypothetical protein
VTAPAEFIASSSGIRWPPALRLFYRYLQERGHIDNSREVQDAIRQIEPEFYDLLRKEFS